MDHRLAKYRGRWKNSFLVNIGLGIDVVALTGILYLGYNTIKLQNESITLKDDMIKIEERIIAFADEHKESDKEGLKTKYPEIIAPPEAALNEGEQKSIEALLTLELSPEEAKKRVRENTCSIETYLVNVAHRSSVERDEVSTGTCIFLTPTLVLTAYHIPNANDFNFFYLSVSSIFTSNNDSITVEEPIAISPRYDLALFRLERTAPHVKPVPVRVAAGDSFLLYSLRENNTKEDMVYTVEEHPLQKIETTEGYSITFEGELAFPSLEVKPYFQNGYSGSPVLRSDGAVVGLLSSSNEESGKSSISDHVYDFLNCVVHQPDCSGWENTAQAL